MSDEELATQHGLAVEEISELRAVFQQFDTDGSGTIDKEELGTALKQMGYTPSDDEIIRMLAEVDDDGSGCIEFPEFLMLMSTKMNATLDDDIAVCWEVFGGKVNGWLSSQEIRRVLVNFGEQLPDSEIDQLIGEADVDGDGEVTWQEFYRMMRTR